MPTVLDVLDRVHRFDPDKATFHARRLDPANVVASIERFGCAWIKGLFDPTELAAFDAIISTNIEGIETVYRKLGFSDDFNIGFPLYFASEAHRQKAQALFLNTYPSVFDPRRMIDVDTTKLASFVFSALRRRRLTVAIGRYLKLNEVCTSAAITHIRNFKPKDTKWFGEFHQDNRLYAKIDEILTLWFPFRYVHGQMPSLEFLPVS